MTKTLFPTDLPDRQWSQFRADGYDTSVAGVVHRATNPPVCGMPLGGIDTGCLDLEVTGLLGYSSIFNCHVPRRGPINQPFLGIAVGKRTWQLTTSDLRARRGETALKPAYYTDSRTHLHNVRADILNAEEIYYWGHYPVADVEYRTSAPVQVGVRAWSPFIPGDVAASNTPAAVFELRLRNESDQQQQVTVALSFPGPNEAEAGTTRLIREEINEPVRGLHVTCPQAGYFLGVIGDESVRCGGELGTDAGAWGHIRLALPFAREQAGSSVAVDFTLAAGQNRTVRFLLTWYSPQWVSGGTPTRDGDRLTHMFAAFNHSAMKAADYVPGNRFTHMYASRYTSALDVATYMADNHTALLRRILAWQSVILTDPDLPVWLRSDLVNYLHLMTEDSFWAQAQPPIGDWCRKEDGLFAINESPRWGPQMECIPNGFYGNIALVYFFPELALSTLRAYKAYQYPDGQMTWIFGGKSNGSPFADLTTPCRGYGEKPQATLDGACYVVMVDRMWMRTGSEQLLREFYDSVKRNTVFTMNLRPGSGPAGIVSMPANNDGSDWMEFTDLFGIVPHIGGVHLAQLRLASRMAQAVGDREFEAQCQEWLSAGSAVMEQHTWTGDYYMLYNELETGKKSNWILGCQLDGQWITHSHGLAGVFQADRIKTTLATLKRTSIVEGCGSAPGFIPPPGNTIEEFDTGYWLECGVHGPGNMMLAMTYMYDGQHDVGMELAQHVSTVIMEQGWTWDIPVVYDGKTHARQGGFDYYQNLMCWAYPAAMQESDFSAPCKPGELVDRIIRAGATT